MTISIRYFGVVLAALSGCATAHGGGTLPSADGNPEHKATFGFSYRCDDDTHMLTGVFNYQDHGTGHRLTGKINEDISVDPNGNPILCGTSLVGEPGITSACGVVSNGAGGVLAGDLIIVAAADEISTQVLDDAIAVGLVHPSTPLDPTATLTIEDCLNMGGNFYYVNQGVLNSGNVIVSGE